MDELLVQMGRRILSRRKQLHMTQEELAECSGVTPQTVSTAELGKKALRPGNIIRICQALNISADYLLTGSVPKQEREALVDKLALLTPSQHRHLEDIIDSYLAALQERDGKT